MGKMRFVVIGYGGMGGWHTKYIGESDVAELAGVYDIKPERNELAESRGIRAYPLGSVCKIWHYARSLGNKKRMPRMWQQIYYENWLWNRED